jgi:ABC-type antimicrobial peptide transport system permease subunit
LLYGLQATNPLVFLSAAIVVVAVTGVAALVPTLRATKIDPIKALQ